MDDSAITCDEIIESYNEETNFNEKKSSLLKTKFLYFTCIFINYYSITDSYYYLIKYRAKQKHLLPLLINNINQKWVIKTKRYRHKNLHILLLRWYYQYKVFWSK